MYDKIHYKLKKIIIIKKKKNKVLLKFKVFLGRKITPQKLILTGYYCEEPLAHQQNKEKRCLLIGKTKPLV